MRVNQSTQHIYVTLALCVYIPQRFQVAHKRLNQNAIAFAYKQGWKQTAINMRGTKSQSRVLEGNKNYNTTTVLQHIPSALNIES